MTGGLRSRVLLFVCIVCAGCSQTEISGIVMNEQGEALPGVSVRVSGTEDHALTNARGEYRIPTAPGEHKLLYAKTGYTIFDQVVHANDAAQVPATDVHLWNLPPENSVFVYKNSRYKSATWVIPKRYYMADGTTDYGTQRDPEVSSDEAMPMLICYRTPRYDTRLTRLDKKEAKMGVFANQPSEDDSDTFMIWSAGGTVGVDLVPVVHSDQSLLKLQILEPLQPGRYAIHWGALEGYTTLDERIFIFEITEEARLNLELVDPELDGQDPKHEIQKGDAP